MPDTQTPLNPSAISAAAHATVTAADIVYLNEVQPQTVVRRWEHCAKFDLGVCSHKDNQSGVLGVEAATRRG